MRSAKGPFSLSVSALALALVLTATSGCKPRQNHPSEEPSPSAAAPTTEEPGPSPTESPLPARRLEPGASLERELAGGDAHAYRIALETEDFLHVVVDQRGVDVVVALFDPAGRKLIEADNPIGAQGPDPIFALAEATGDYRLEVRPWSETTSGPYAVTIEARRPATARDRSAAAAARAFAEGERLSRHDEADALRDAVKSYEEALSLWRASQERFQETITERQLGRLWFRQGEVRTAVAHYERALALVVALGRRDQEASLRNQTGAAYRLLGDTQKALAAYEEALRVARDLDDRREETVSLNNLALLHKFLGEPWKAILLYDQALQGWRDLDDRAGEAATLHNIGTTYTLLDRTPEALDALNRALELRRAAGDRGREASTLTVIGWAHLRAGEIETALRDFSDALELRRMVGDRRGEAVTLDRLGTTHLESGRIEEALASYERALEIFRDVGDRLSEAHTLNNVGELYEYRDEPEKALGYHDAALRLFQEMQERNGEAYCHFRSAQAQRRRGNLSAARADVEKALGIVESLRIASQSPTLRSSYFGSVHDHYELYIDLLIELHATDPGQGYDILALEASERSRARSFLETLSEAHVDLRAGADPELVEREQTLKRAINAKERERMELAAAEPAAAAPAALETEIRDLFLEYEKVRTRIRASSPAAAGLIRAEPLGVREIQEQVLDDETLLLTYSLGEERSFLGLVSRNRVAVYELPGRAEIEATALRLHRLLSRSQRRGVKVQARLAAAALGELLLGPVAEQLGRKRLLVVGDGSLHYVPFAALSVSAGTGQRADDGADRPRAPLIVDHEIVTLPSASVLAVLRRELVGRPVAPGILAVLADPVFRSDDPRLREPASPTATGRGEPDDSGMLVTIEGSAGNPGFFAGRSWTQTLSGSGSGAVVRSESIERGLSAGTRSASCRTSTEATMPGYRTSLRSSRAVRPRRRR
ncbi:MAG: tetratricopeptide repeat protein [bacterium]|nr:tetratricopeptide repeat protein [bacterium]